MTQNIYYIFGAVFMVYLVITISNRGKSKDRKSRRFMGDYKRKEKKE